MDIMKNREITIDSLSAEELASLKANIREQKEYKALLLKKSDLLKRGRYVEAMNLSQAIAEVEERCIRTYLQKHQGETVKVKSLIESMTPEEQEMMSAYGNALVMLADVMETMTIECNTLIQKYHPKTRIEMFDKLTEIGKEAKKHVRMLDDYSSDDYYTSAYGDATDNLAEMAVNKAKGFIRKIKRHEERANKKASRNAKVA